jgi:ornithine cyclodeaminase/alanine dehydrogenase-like protein (mu-crystallin family)
LCRRFDFNRSIYTEPYRAYAANMLILSNDDAEQLLTMADCIAALETVYREMAEGRAANAVRSDAVTQTARADTVYSLKMMGGVVQASGIGVVRINSDILSFANKRQVKLPLAPGDRYTGLVLLFSIATGEPLAIFPDGILQRMRVGATSALGARYLARKDASSVAVIGSGWQAGGHVMAIAAQRKLDGCKLDEIRCYSPTRDKREAFCREMSALTGVSMRPCATPEEAVGGAGIVLCATNASQHVFLEKWMEPGMYVCTIRGPEVEPGVVLKADVAVLNDRVVHENVSITKGVVLPKNRHAIEGFNVAAAPTLAELVAGMAPGRQSAAQKTVFVNLPGLGLQFAAVGAALYEKARAAGRGHELPTEWFTEDVVP